MSHNLTARRLLADLRHLFGGPGRLLAHRAEPIPARPVVAWVPGPELADFVEVTPACWSSRTSVDPWGDGR